jgi:hypothetical protein
MTDNKTLILEHFEQHKGQFIIMGTDVVRLIAVGDDGEDYYWVTYNGRKTHWHSCVGGFIILKGKIDERDYNCLIRMAKLNHFDQGNLDDLPIINNHKEQTTCLPEDHIYLAGVCWDLN